MVINLVGVINSKKQQVLIFNKSETLFDLFTDILLEIGEENLFALNDCKGTIKDMKDEILTFEGSRFQVSIIFGKNKVFFVGSYSPSMRNKVLDIVKKKCVFKGKKLF